MEILAADFGRTRVRHQEESRGSVHRRIGVFEDKKLLHEGIAIRDLPNGSEPFDSRDTWREIPQSQGSGN